MHTELKDGTSQKLMSNCPSSKKEAVAVCDCISLCLGDKGGDHEVLHPPPGAGPTGPEQSPPLRRPSLRSHCSTQHNPRVILMALFFLTPNPCRSQQRIFILIPESKGSFDVKSDQAKGSVADHEKINQGYKELPPHTSRSGY